MNENETKLILLIGRFIAGLFYVYYGIDNLINLPDRVRSVEAEGVALPWFAVTIASLLLLIGGLSILTGYKPVIGSAAILLFLIPVTLKMHDFWTVTDPLVRMVEVRNFWSNVGLAGSTLIFFAVPRPWVWSLEAFLQRQATGLPSLTRVPKKGSPRASGRFTTPNEPNFHEPARGLRAHS